MQQYFRVALAVPLLFAELWWRARGVCENYSDAGDHQGGSFSIQAARDGCYTKLDQSGANAAVPEAVIGGVACLVGIGSCG